jgi:hypothetical protein
MKLRITPMRSCCRITSFSSVVHAPRESSQTRASNCSSSSESFSIRSCCYLRTNRSNDFVQLQVDGFSISVLSVLDKEHH